MSERNYLNPALLARVGCFMQFTMSIGPIVDHGAGTVNTRKVIPIAKTSGNRGLNNGTD